MRIPIITVLTTCLALSAQADNDSYIAELKGAAIASIDQQASSLIKLSDSVWEFAEVALAETESSRVLAHYAEAQGFRVERDVAGMPTGFIAEYGKGNPVIGILGEYDALPRLSQKATPWQQARVSRGAGHGCGHNLFGAASMGAALAIKELIAAGEIKGTVRYYGTPAEEAVGGKIYMAREGLFDDLDAVLSWHPNSKSEVDMSGSQAMVETLVEFRGRAAHAALDPWNGRSALDGVELFTHSLNLWREHLKPTVRMHYTIADGGGAPNVVPETASTNLWIRDLDMESVLPLYERMQTMAAATAKAAGVTSEVTLISGTYNMLQNEALAKIAHANMQKLGPIEFDAADERFARKLQDAMGVPDVGLDGSLHALDLAPTTMEGGSTDVADVSWIVPTVDVDVTTAPTDIPWHSWGVVASSGSPIGHKGMLHAAKVLATTAVDLYVSPKKLEAIKAEFDEVTNGFKYKAYIPDGAPPIPGA